MTRVGEQMPRDGEGEAELRWVHGTPPLDGCQAPVVTVSDCGTYRITATTDPRLADYVGAKVDIRGPFAEHLERLLELLDERFTRAGIVYWIAGQTLLGCIRDGRILPWAHDVEVIAWNVDAEQIRALDGLGAPEFAIDDARSDRAVRIVCAGPKEPEGVFPLRRRKLGSIEVNVPSASAALLVRQFGEEGSQQSLVACACQAARGEHLFAVCADPARPLRDEIELTRITTTPGETAAPRIERKSVDAFFAARAAKIESVGPTSAVIYQDKNPELALRRDAAERALLLPKIDVHPGTRVLDVGCGTGRWTEDLVDAGAIYHGIDGCEGFIEHARALHGARPAARFSVCPAEKLDLATIGETEAFDRVLCFGVLIYLNDEEVMRTLAAMSAAARPQARIVIREPVGIGNRLTIRNHYSGDMDQMYNAVYRTEDELLAMIAATLGPDGFRLLDKGDVFAEASLNNRTETKQRWLMLER